MAIICNKFSPDTAFTCDTAMYNLGPSAGVETLALIPYAFRKRASVAPTFLPEFFLQPLIAYEQQALSNRTIPATNCNNLEPSATDLAQNTGTCTTDGSVELALALQELGLSLGNSARAHSSFLLYSSLRDAGAPPWAKWAMAPFIPSLQLAANPLLFDQPIDWRGTGQAALISVGTLGQAQFSESALTDTSVLFLDSATTFAWHHRSESLWAQRKIAEENGPRNLALVSLGSMFVPAAIGSTAGTEAFIESTKRSERIMLLSSAAVLTGSGLIANRNEGALAMASAPAGIATGVASGLGYHYVLKPYVFTPLRNVCHQIFSKDK